MNNSKSFPVGSSLPVTIGTPFGEIRLTLRPCGCGLGDHYAYRIEAVSPLLERPQSSVFLYKLAGTLEGALLDVWGLNAPDEVLN